MSKAARSAPRVSAHRARLARERALQYRLEHAAFRAARAIFGRLKVDRASALGGWVARRFGPIFARRAHRRARANLHRALPDRSGAEIRAILGDVWENLGRTATEFFHLDAFRPFEEGGRVSVEGAEHLEAVKAAGRPAVFVSGHFANWEVAAIVLHRAGVETCVAYRPANNLYVDEAIIETRAAVMSSVTAPKGPEGMRKMLAALKAGRSLALLTDQKLNDGVEATLLGRPAMTAPAPARLALRFGAPIIPLAIERNGGANFTVRIYPPIETRELDRNSEDMLTGALTQQINDFLSERILARPGEWLWLHNRWADDA
ncbi:MAG: lysophospholipid acyltransferase family protein [Parvularculaceae bacterium]